MATDAQRAAWKRYADAGKRATLTMSLTRADYDNIHAYAAAQGLTGAMCARECVRRCMVADGWTGTDTPAPSQLAPDETAMPAPVLVEPIKRKPGRPRKVQPEQVAPDAQQQPKRGRGRPRKNAPTE